MLAPLEPYQLEQLLDSRLLLAARHAVELGEVAQVVVAGEPLVHAALAAEDVPDALPHLACLLDDVVAQHARTSPAVGMSSVISILIVVVLPAPFGPSSPNSSPLAISKETPRTASISFERRRSVPVCVL